MRALLVVVAVVLATGCANSNKPSKSACARMHDQYLDVMARVASIANLTDKQKQALADTKAELKRRRSDEFISKCRAQLTKAQVACAAKAKTSDELDTCVHVAEN